MEVVAAAAILMVIVMLWFKVLVGCIGTYAVVLRRRRRGWTLFKRILFVGKGLIYSLTGAYSKLADLLNFSLAGLCD
ncbi:MAG: hypothetical protein QXI39_07035 [Candidatus Bathyarchaeia archaeon]